MASRNVKDFNGVNEALQELYGFMDRYTLYSVDFNKRRIRNADIGVLPDDYVVLKQLPKFSGGVDLASIKRAASSNAANYDKITFGIGVGSSVVVGNDVTPPFIWSNSRRGKPEMAFIAANIPPVGADIIVDILKNGISIFGTTKLHLPAGYNPKLAKAYTDIFDTGVTFVRNDILSCNITQIGNTLAGSGVQIVIFCPLT